MNVTPLATKALFSNGDPTAAGRVLNGLIVARIPLFFFQAIQASLMPKLSADAAAGRFDEFRLLLRRILLLAALVIVVSVVGMALLGPPLLQILFHSSRPLGRVDLALLALGSEGMMAAFALAYACIALRGYRGATAGWVAGSAALVLALVVLPGTLLRVEVSFCVAVAVACGVTGIALAGYLRHAEAVAASPQGAETGSLVGRSPLHRHPVRRDGADGLPAGRSATRRRGRTRDPRRRRGGRTRP